MSLCANEDVQASIKKSTNIPAQELVAALKTLAHERGFQVVFRSEVVGTRRTQGAMGDLTTTEALTKLLEGTGLTYSYLDENTVTIVTVNSNNESDGQGPAAGNLQRCPGFSSAKADSPASPNQAASGSAATNWTAAHGGSGCVESHPEETKILPGAPRARVAPVRNGDADSNLNEKSPESARLEEIVVTAQRKVQSLQDVPISISVLNDKQLTGAGVRTTEDLGMAVPGLQIVNASGAGNVYLRGVGTGNNTAGNESSVALYVDDVYYADSLSVITSLANVERVEVLKGPQGTLYGRNATGGLIHIITPEPQAKGFATLEVGYEEYDTVTGSLYATGGFSDHLKASLSVNAHDQREGFGTNLPTHQDANSVNYSSYRGKLLWEPTAADGITLSGNYYRDTSDYGFYYNLAPGKTAVTGGTFPGDPWDALYGTNVHHETVVWDMSLNWTHAFESGAVLKSISAYLDLYYRLRGFDVDADAPAVVAAQVPRDGHTLQQEFLLQGSTTWLNHPLEYSTGLFYFTNDSSVVIDISLPAAVVRLQQGAKTTTNSYAALGQVDFGLTDRDTLTAGFRYTIDQQRLDALETTTTPLGMSVRTGQGDKDFGELTWRLALKHAFTDDLMAYGGYSRGYKSGLFNTVIPPSNEPPAAVNPETLDAYDIGLKGTFLRGGLQLGLDSFYYDYKNLQVQNVINSTAVMVSNASNAEIYGLEAAVLAAVPAPAGDLQLSANVGYLHGEYTEYANCRVAVPNPVPPGGNSFLTGNCSGNQLADAPAYQMTVGLNYTVPLRQLGGKLGLSMSYHHSSEFFYDADNALRQPAYDTLAAELSYAFLKDRARVRVYGRNLTDEVLRQGCQTTDYSTVCIAAPPRVVGVAFSYRWDAG